MQPTPILSGFGFYVPEKVLTNADFERMVETTDEWITSRSGIKERHFAAPGQTSADMACEAAKIALADAGLAAEDLTHILLMTFTPDTVCPSAACALQDKLGIKGRMALDMNAACSGFLYGLEMARALVALHPEAKILLAASEVLSSRTNFNDRTTCVLFGDGCGAVIVEAGEPKPGAAKLRDVAIYSDGGLGYLLTIKAGGSGYPLKLGDTVGEDFFVQMAGREVFKHAVRHMEEVCNEVLGRNNLTSKDLGLFISHQANLRIIEAVGNKLGLPDGVSYVNIDRYGNTSAASIPIALAEARGLGRIKSGDKVMLSAFGGGLTWGAVLLEF